MPIRTVPNTDVKYYLISFDKKGRERTDDQDAAEHDGRLSDAVRAVLRDEPITDVFFTSHGWKGDVPAAIDQYDRWIGAMAQCTADRERIQQQRPGYRSIIIGVHWPSKPWGEEDQPSSVAFGDLDSNPIEAAADAIADTPAARAALMTIFEAADEDMLPAELPPEVITAYLTLADEAGLVSGGPAAAPGDDADAFDPAAAYAASRAGDSGVDFKGGVVGGVLSVLGQLSYWTMKKRARKVGETGIGDLLRGLMSDAGDRDVRFHLMGHSFGCIVMSATLAGRGGDGPLPRPVSTLFLVQGALSLWAYCGNVLDSGKAGYFRAIVDPGAGAHKLSGPFVVTHSEHDTAVGTLYPLASKVHGSPAFDEGDLPKYGAIGAFGVRGPGIDLIDLTMGSVTSDYPFEAGKVYNLDASEVIQEMQSKGSGAHNDIDHAEVGHVFWQAAMVGLGDVG